MKDSIYPQMKIIENNKYILRPVCLDDATSMFEYYSQERVVKYLPIKVHKSIAETRRFIKKHFIEHYKRGNVSHWAIIDKSNNKVIGNAGLNNVSLKDNQGEIGICINPMYWGKNIASEITNISLYYGFKHLNLEKIIAITYVDNPSTKKSLESLGFKYVKSYNKKAKTFNESKNIKCNVYEILRKDYILYRYLN